MDNNFNEKKIQDIVRAYEEARSQGVAPYMDSDDLNRLSDYYHQRGDMQKALDVADYTLQLYPGAAQPLAFKARAALLLDHDVDKAGQLVEQIEDKTDLEYYYAVAEIMLFEGKAKEANGYLYNVYCDLNDDDDEADFVIDVACLFADYDEMDLAELWIDRSDEPDDMDYREVKGRIALSRGDYKAGESIFSALLDEDPYSGFYWNKLAAAQFMANRIDEAIQSSEYAVAINPNDDEATLNKANGLYALNNYEGALEWYRRYAKLCPDEPTAEAFIGTTLVNLGRLQEAVDHLKIAAKKIDKDSPVGLEILKELAFCLIQSNRADEALKCLDQADEQNSDPEKILKVMRGHIYLTQGRQEEARLCFEEAMQGTEDSQRTFLYIAESVYDCGYLHLAYKMFHYMSSKLGDKMTDGLGYLAACAKTLGKRKEYLRVLKNACERNPDEIKEIMGSDFPEDMSPNDYYDYAFNHPDK